MVEAAGRIAAVMATAAEIRELVGKLRRRLHLESKLGEFSWAQVEVLTWLEREGPATVTILARAQGVRPQSMGETLSGLRAAGFVVGTPDPADGRQTLLALSDAFRKELLASRAAKEDWLFRAMSTKLQPVEQEQLAAGVALLWRLVEE